MVENDFRRTKRGFVLTKEARKRELARVRKVFEKEEEIKAKIAEKKLRKELLDLKMKRLRLQKESKIKKKKSERKAKKRRKAIKKAIKKSLKGFFKIPKLRKIRL